MITRVAMITDLPETGEAFDGGVQAVSSYLVSELSQIPSVKLYVVTFRPGIRTPRKLIRADYVHYQVPIGRYGTLTGFAADRLNLRRILDEIKPDLVHSQGAGHHGILAARSNYPFVTTIHGIQSQEASYQPTLRRRLRARLQSWLANYYCIRRATHTILISPYVAKYYGSALSGKRYSIPNPVDSRYFDVIRQEEPNRVLFLGRLYSLKGVHDLIAAAATLPMSKDLQLVLGGSLADTKYVNDLRALASRLNLNESVHMPGILPVTEVQHELSKCCCLVLPSYQETAPMVIQEAMASGVPVIASAICGIPHQIIDGCTGFLVPPGDVEALADRMSILLTNAKLRQEFGVAARQKAFREYRAEYVAERTLEVYRDMLS